MDRERSRSSAPPHQRQPLGWQAVRQTAAQPSAPAPPAAHHSQHSQHRQQPVGPRSFPALRSDGPSRKPYGHGRQPDLSTRALQEAALEDLDTEIYSASNSAPVKARRLTIARLLSPWPVEAFPATTTSLRMLGASLKAGGYRSAANVLSQYKVDCERRGQNFDSSLLRSYADVVRSCRRGLGPARQAAPLPMDRLAELPGGEEPWTSGGPVGPRNAIICGAFWLLRETELAGARASLVNLLLDGPPTAGLTLPASKSDQEGVGATRFHSCLCGGGPPRPLCPVHSIWDQMWVLKRRFPDMFAGDLPADTLPLFPTTSGRPVTKQGMVGTIVWAAVRLRIPLESPDGAEHVTGHSLRPTGAQGLCRLGMDPWAIQVLGRWGSSVVQRYIRSAVSSAPAAQARRHALARSLRDIGADAAKGLSELEIRRLTAAEVEACMTRLAPTLTEAFREQWRQDLATELARQRGQDSTSSSSSSSAEEPPEAADPPAQNENGRNEVASVHSRKKHRILIGPETVLDATSWTTVCGWYFGRSSGARDPDRFDSQCAKRLPLHLKSFLLGVNQAPA